MHLPCEWSYLPCDWCGCASPAIGRLEGWKHSQQFSSARCPIRRACGAGGRPAGPGCQLGVNQKSPEGFRNSPEPHPEVTRELLKPTRRVSEAVLFVCFVCLFVCLFFVCFVCVVGLFRTPLQTTLPMYLQASSTFPVSWIFHRSWFST